MNFTEQKLWALRFGAECAEDGMSRDVVIQLLDSMGHRPLSLTTERALNAYDAATRG